MFIKPATRAVLDPDRREPLLVPDPERGDYLPKEGREVTPSDYWTRRVLDGDVKEATPPAQPPAEAAVPQTQTDARPPAARTKE